MSHQSKQKVCRWNYFTSLKIKKVIKIIKVRVSLNLKILMKKEFHSFKLYFFKHYSFLLLLLLCYIRALAVHVCSSVLLGMPCRFFVAIDIGYPSTMICNICRYVDTAYIIISRLWFDLMKISLPKRLMVRVLIGLTIVTVLLVAN